MSIQWTIQETDLLVAERYTRNQEFHATIGRSRVLFWRSVARHINRSYNSNYSWRQCEIRWRNLRSDYTVNKK
jgi:hypothetical protein